MNSLVSEWTSPDSTRDRTILTTDTLKALNAKSISQGLIQLIAHFLILGVSGWLWGTTWGQNWAITLPALIIYGFGLAAMFAPLHECAHRTAFTNHARNDALYWLAFSSWQWVGNGNTCIACINDSPTISHKIHA